MFSVNVPVPGTVAAAAMDLRPALTDFERIRDRYTCVLKRLDVTDREGFLTVSREVRRVVRGTPPFAVQLDGFGVFRDPPAGPAPVLYLSVEGDGLTMLHEQLVESFDCVEGLEGPDYQPHITLSRGGSVDVDEVMERIDPPLHTWSVNRLTFWDGRRGERAGEISLPD